MDAKTYEQFLHDFGLEIRELALEAKAASSQRGSSSEHRAIAFGRVVAFAQMITLLQEKLAAFGIPAETMSLAGIDPDRDLL